DHFTETTSQGFFSRVGNSLLGLIIGPLVVVCAIVLLSRNEGRAVQAMLGLKGAGSQVVEAEGRPTRATAKPTSAPFHTVRPNTDRWRPQSPSRAQAQD